MLEENSRVFISALRSWHVSFLLIVLVPTQKMVSVVPSKPKSEM